MSLPQPRQSRSLVPGGHTGRPYGGDAGAAGQPAFRNHTTRRERPLRGPDARCALSTTRSDCRGPARNAAWIRAGIKPAPTVRAGNSRVNAAVCSIPPCSEAAGAAFEERCVAVTIVRFYCPARSIEGVWGTGRDGPEESSCPRNASPGDARRTAKRGPGAAAPGAFWELFRGEKFPAGGSPACVSTAPAAPHRAVGGALIHPTPARIGTRPGRSYRPPLPGL